MHLGASVHSHRGGGLGRSDATFAIALLEKQTETTVLLRGKKKPINVRVRNLLLRNTLINYVLFRTLCAAAIK